MSVCFLINHHLMRGLTEVYMSSGDLIIRHLTKGLTVVIFVCISYNDLLIQPVGGNFCMYVIKRHHNSTRRRLFSYMYFPGLPPQIIIMVAEKLLKMIIYRYNRQIYFIFSLYGYVLAIIIENGFKCNAVII